MALRSAFLIAAIALIASAAPGQQNYWQKKSDAVGFNIGINPLNPNTIYCERTSGIISVSRDRGQTWTDFPASPGISGIRHILVHPNDTMTIFVCEFFNNGLMRTTDEGATWSTVIASYGIDGESIDYDPAHPDTMYAGKFSDGSVYRTTDRGATWALQGISGPNLCGLIVRPDSANVLYAGTGASRISKSTDEGVTWRIVNNGGTEEVPKFAINPQNPLVGYATTYGEPDSIDNLWKTTDGGESWFKTGLQKIGVWSLAIDPQHPETLYVGRFGETRGVDRTTDGGVTFTHYEDGVTPNFAAWNLRVHPLEPTTVWMAGTETFFGAGGVYQFVHKSFGSIEGSITADLNAGKSRDTSDKPLSGWKVYLTSGPTMIDSALTDTSGTYLLSHVDSGAYAITAESRSGWVNTYPAAGSYSLALPAGIDTSGFDFGEFLLPRHAVTEGWNMLSLPVAVADPRTATQFPAAASTAFSYEGHYVGNDSLAPGRGYWLKFPGPDTVSPSGTPSAVETVAVKHGWNIVGVPSLPVMAGTVTSIPGGLTGSAFFGYSGTYTVADTLVPGEAYWIRVNGDGALVLGGGGGPAAQSYRIEGGPETPPPAPEVPGSTKLLPVAYGLEQNFPNPFNPAAVIKYELPEPGFVAMIVYDLLGRQVAVLKDGMEDAGFLSVEWHAAGMASGVYICRLEVSDPQSGAVKFTATRKMLLLR